MRRREIIQLLDGTHPTRGRALALTHQGLIVLSGLAISLETLSGLPLWLHNLLLRFEVFIVGVFILEYVTRVICTPRPLRYVFSFWGIVDLLSCLPALSCTIRFMVLTPRSAGPKVCSTKGSVVVWSPKPSPSQSHL